jgi:hypothetical protein
MTKDAISFIGPEFVFRTPLGQQQKLLLEAKYAIGYIGYKEKISMLGEAATIQGGSTGLHLGLGLEYKFDKHCGLFLNCAATTGALNRFTTTDQNGKVEQTTLEKGQYEGLQHLSIALGFRFHIK